MTSPKKRPTRGGAGASRVPPGTPTKAATKAELDLLAKSAATLRGPNKPRVLEEFYGWRQRTLDALARIKPAAERHGLRPSELLTALQNMPAPNLNQLQSLAQDLLRKLPVRDGITDFDTIRRDFIANYESIERMGRDLGLTMSSRMQTLYNNARANFGRMLGGTSNGSALLSEAEHELESMLVRAGL